MKIQLIGTNPSRLKFNGIETSPLDHPKSLDEFDIDVIDLSGPSLWRHKGDTTSKIDKMSDFTSLQTMVQKKAKAIVLFVLPQNETFNYNYSSSVRGGYFYSIPLKDMMDDLCQRIINRIIPEDSLPLRLIFENTRTTIGEKAYEADFYFESTTSILTESDCSEKPTTVKLSDNDVYATTLKVTESAQSLMPFLNCLFSGDKIEDAPDWFSEISFDDDLAQRTLISQKETEIESAQQAILIASERLSENNRYKSILYSNGNELVEVVFDILEQTLGCDLSKFEDKKSEDFLIETDRYTLIGEIKGVTSNVRSENISQVDNHYHSYLDNHPGIDASTVHQILIINPLRKQKPDEREPVHEKQINLAKRNGCIIIKTETLLRLYEQFRTGVMTSEQCEDLLCSTTGLLDLSKDCRLSPDELEAYKI